MAVKQTVMLKGQKGGISIILDADASFETIKDNLRRKVSMGKQFFEGADTKISFKGRVLSELDEKILVDIVQEETNLEITMVADDDFMVSSQAPAQVKEKAASTPLPEISALTETSPPRHGHMESKTAYYQGGLRSGQSIHYKGSVVILGDVNPGSEVVADGNVVVLGALKGMAHAGASGDKSCFVSALFLKPTQLRVADIISFVPDTASTSRSGAAYAYIKDGQVFIGPL